MAKGLDITTGRKVPGSAVLFWMTAMAAVCLAGGDRPVSPAGPLSVEPGFVSIDSLQAGTVERVEFLIRNAGDQAVRLLLISAQCDCSVALPGKGLVPAGGLFALEADLLLADAEPGFFQETITIVTDHPDQGVLSIPIRGTVIGSNDRLRVRADAPPRDGEGIP